MVFPRTCVGCGAPGRFLCDRCRPQLLSVAMCPVCGRGLEGWSVHPGCSSRLPLDKLVICGAYEGSLAKAIRSVKYDFTFAIVEELASLLSRSILPEWRQGRATLVPVPLHKSRQSWRGFNQAELLALGTAELNGLGVSGSLVRSRETPPQVGLGAGARHGNVAGAFRVANCVPPYCVLIDDVTTTGATLGECAKALRSAGARRVDGLVLAHERKREGPGYPG